MRLLSNIAHAERVPPGTQALDIIVPISNVAGSGQVNAGVEIAQRLLSQVIDSVDLILDEWFPHMADKNLFPTGLNGFFLSFTPFSTRILKCPVRVYEYVIIER